MSTNAIEDKSFDFAVRIVNLYKFITKEKNEFVISKQLLRCGTSIGANVTESQQGQSTADFLSKLNIALKESVETRYWLKLLYKTEYITTVQFDSMESDLKEIISLLTAICKTTKNKM
ncbi:MAG: four helix bundle protein [Clostridia bacterium]|nr:four helix bundle protein [Clostridia bacterium]